MTPHRPLTTGQHAVLQGLAEDSRPITIATGLGVSRARVCQIIDRLVDLDLVARHGPATYPGYLITPEGREALR